MNNVLPFFTILYTSEHREEILFAHVFYGLLLVFKRNFDCFLKKLGFTLHMLANEKYMLHLVCCFLPAVSILDRRG